ncbi:MAG: sigma 54-interacting transcriptional regulator [Myxococcota bacterium]
MSDDITLTNASPQWGETTRDREAVPMLSVLWSLDEPHRVGEVLIVDTYGAGVFGRQSSAVTPQHLSLHRLRPGDTKRTGLPATRRLSRAQLKVEIKGRHLQIENVGRCKLIVNGDVTQAATVRPGALVELEHQLLMLCVMRPPYLHPTQGLRPFPFGEADDSGIVGESDQLWSVREQIVRLASRPNHILIRGPSGVGKELVARALHAHSPRKRMPLVARSAATFPEGLMDAELFGNVQNYPNPGMPARPGLIGEADRSSLFLDEIGELPEAMQAHLLRVLDQGEYHRLGESKARKADFRLIAATNRPEQRIKADLLARLIERILIPDLNHRREDIPLIVTHLLRQGAVGDPSLSRQFFQDGRPRLSPPLIAALTQHRYTTNVRELHRLLWQCIDGSRGDFITLVEGNGLSLKKQPPPPPPKRTVPNIAPEQLSPEQIQACLDKHKGIQEKVWQELGLSSRHQLARLIKKHGLVVRKRH